MKVKVVSLIIYHGQTIQSHVDIFNMVKSCGYIAQDQAICVYLLYLLGTALSTIYRNVCPSDDVRCLDLKKTCTTLYRHAVHSNL